MPMTTDDRDLDRDVAGAAGAHQRLLAAVDHLDAAGIDAVLAALDGLNAHAGRHLALFGASSPGQRGADPVARCRTMIWALESVWARNDDWTVRVETGRTRRELPFLRWRAVEQCHLRLGEAGVGIDYGIEDLPVDYVRLELRTLEMLWRARRPMGLSVLPDRAMASPDRIRLAWLLGRAELPGLAPAALAPLVVD